jgi:transcriptional regulator with XRE-family HTH domain
MLVRLKAIRLRCALSQKELAAKAGISESTVKLIERGAVNPHPKTARQLAEALGVQPWELIDAEGKAAA